MTEHDELEPLEELPTLEAEAVDGANPSVPEQTLATLRSGLPAPAHNPRAEADYYRFMFASLFVLLGSLMPWGLANGNLAGASTFMGGLCLIYGIILVWRWWAAIHTRKVAGKDMLWVFAGLVPFFWILFSIISPFSSPAMKVWAVQNLNVEADADPTWGSLFDAMGGENGGGMTLLNEFTLAFGPGLLMVFIGSILLEVFVVMAIFGGAKKVQEQKAAARAAASERRRK